MPAPQIIEAIDLVRLRSYAREFDDLSEGATWPAQAFVEWIAFDLNDDRRPDHRDDPPRRDDGRWAAR